MRVWSDLFSVQNLFYEIFPYTPGGVILKLRGQDESFGVNRKFPTVPTGPTHAVGDYMVGEITDDA